MAKKTTHVKHASAKKGRRAAASKHSAAASKHLPPAPIRKPSATLSVVTPARISGAPKSAFSLSSTAPLPYFQSSKPQTPSVAPTASGPLSDEQTFAMLDLGKRCYSLFGQTRWFWSHLNPPLSSQPWLRFHFLQASLLSWFFISAYVISAVLALFSRFTGFSILPPFWPEAIFLLALLTHFILFTSLSRQAADGKVPIVPLFGDRAIRLASGTTPLSIWKF